MNKTLYKVLNYGLSSGGWFACALGAAHGFPWAGPLVVGAAAGLHLWQGAPDWRREARYLGLAALFGFVVDSLFAASGFIVYQGGFVNGLAPLWITAMWVLFAIQLNASLRWLHGRMWLAVPLRAWGGISSYFAGQGLGAIEIMPTPLTAGIILGVVWALAVPVLLWLGERVTEVGAANNQA
ncbi:MAG TPA: DUF2878 domain-containing protein [Anaerolineales bacterium]|nr:DUF2878 domain-containing protein [Anaerolineales bacterium]